MPKGHSARHYVGISDKTVFVAFSSHRKFIYLVLGETRKQPDQEAGSKVTWKEKKTWKRR